MDKLRNKYKKLIGKDAPENMSKVMLEKYISWYSQLKSKQELKELQALLKGNKTIITGAPTQLVREYQGKKHEVSIIDGDFFYMGMKYKSLSKIARVITGTNWNGKLFFRVSGVKTTR